MSKLVEIDACGDCPFIGGSGYCEKLNEFVVIVFGSHIDTRCPLPNAPEGAHCADTPRRVDNHELLEALKGMMRGDCFCECGIDNPMMDGKHSEACIKAREAIAKAEGNADHIPDTGKMVCPHCGASPVIFETSNNGASSDAVCNRCKKSMPPGWSTNHT
jgi:hypothetical protein